MSSNGPSKTISMVVSNGKLQVYDVSQIFTYTNEPSSHRATKSTYRVTNPDFPFDDVSSSSYVGTPQNHVRPKTMSERSISEPPSYALDGSASNHGSYVLPHDSTTDEFESFGIRGGVSHATAYTHKNHDINMSLSQKDRLNYRSVITSGTQLKKEHFYSVPSHILKSTDANFDPDSRSLVNWCQYVAPLFGLDDVMIQCLEVLKKFHSEPAPNTPARNIYISKIMEYLKNYHGDPMELFDSCCRV